MFGRNRYLCDVRREKSPADKEGVYCIRPKEQNRQKRTRRMKGHDAPLFCICHVRGPCAAPAYQDGVGVLFPFISGEAFGDACFLMNSKQSPHAFSITLNLMPNSGGL